MRLGLIIAVIAILAMAVGAVAIGIPRGGPVASTSNSVSLELSGLVAYNVNGMFVSRFCSNSSSISRTGDEAAGLQPSGSAGPIGTSVVSVGWKNTGSSPVQVLAACVKAVGFVPANATNLGLVSGATARTLQLSVLPSNAIQQGVQANITATFIGGSAMYYMPQGGLTYTIIAADGSTVSWSGPEGGGYLTTGTAQTPLVSLKDASLLSGSPPILSAVLRFNSTIPITEVDISLNGTYIGTAGVGHDTSSSGAPTLFNVSYKMGIDESGRVAIVKGQAYLVTFVAATRGFQETSVSTTVVAG